MLMRGVNARTGAGARRTAAPCAADARRGSAGTKATIPAAAAEGRTRGSGRETSSQAITKGDGGMQDVEGGKGERGKERGAMVGVVGWRWRRNGVSGERRVVGTPRGGGSHWVAPAALGGGHILHVSCVHTCARGRSSSTSPLALQ